MRLQKLLGHTTPLMTLRYMKHGPESYFREDAASIAHPSRGSRMMNGRLVQKRHDGH